MIVTSLAQGLSGYHKRFGRKMEKSEIGEEEGLGDIWKIGYNASGGDTGCYDGIRREKKRKVRNNEQSISQ